MLTIYSDNESHGDGTLTVFNSKTVTTFNGDMTVTAWDIDMAGSVDAGIAAITIHGSTTDQTFGMGQTAKDMHLTDAEIGRLTGTGGLSVGSLS